MRSPPTGCESKQEHPEYEMGALYSIQDVYGIDKHWPRSDTTLDSYCTRAGKYLWVRYTPHSCNRVVRLHISHTYARLFHVHTVCAKFHCELRMSLVSPWSSSVCFHFIYPTPWIHYSRFIVASGIGFVQAGPRKSSPPPVCTCPCDILSLALVYCVEWLNS
jgi:hypothetical protein